jgi:hypothetical protein
MQFQIVPFDFICEIKCRRTFEVCGRIPDNPAHALAPLPDPASHCPMRAACSACWWRRQSPSRQDRFATLGPLLSVLLFLAAIISAFWYLRNEEIERETESVKRDTEITQQQIGLRLIQNQEQLVRMARELVTRDVDAAASRRQAAEFMRERPEITHLTGWAGRRARAARTGPAVRPDELLRPGASPTRLPSGAATANPSRPSAPRATPPAGLLARLQGRHGAGVPAAGAADRPQRLQRRAGGRVLGRRAAAQLRAARGDTRHAVAVIDDRPRSLASTVPMPGQAQQSPRADRQRRTAGAGRSTACSCAARATAPVGLISNTLFWMVVALSVLTVWMLLGTWRHMRRRAADPGRAGAGDQLPPRDGELHAHRHARDGHGRPHHLRQPAFCR